MGYIRDLIFQVDKEIAEELKLKNKDRTRLVELRRRRREYVDRLKYAVFKRCQREINEACKNINKKDK